MECDLERTEQGLDKFANVIVRGKELLEQMSNLRFNGIQKSRLFVASSSKKMCDFQTP